MEIILRDGIHKVLQLIFAANYPLIWASQVAQLVNLPAYAGDIGGL